MEIDEVNNSRDKHLTFYKFWTRKEAIVKAIGKGIDDDLIKIPITDGSHSVPSALVYNFKEVKVFSFNLNDDYIGAIAFTEDIHDFERIVFYPSPSSDKLMSLFS